MKRPCGCPPCRARTSREFDEIILLAYSSNELKTLEGAVVRDSFSVLEGEEVTLADVWSPNA